MADENDNVSSIQIDGPQMHLDIVTISGLFISLVLIVSALVVGGSPQAFVNPAALMIVVGGTLAVTAVSYMSEDLKKTGKIVMDTIFYPKRSASKVAEELMDLAVLARKKGVLAVSEFEDELQNDPWIKEAFSYLVDGFEENQVTAILKQNLDTSVENARKSAGILRRAAEVAPAMGLIGTLVGLVQMLSVLKEPDNIGPAMAIALLTTFYGAILGTVIIGPLAAKIERKSRQDILIKELILAAALSITHKENPRQLEIQLNALLPAEDRIIYFS